MWRDPETDTVRRKPQAELPLFDFANQAHQSASDSAGLAGRAAVRLGGSVMSDKVGEPARVRVSDPHKIRLSKRHQIEVFFVLHLGTKFSTAMLHQRFGPSFRSRVSEINKDEACPIVIRQTGRVQGDSEISHYWGERRTP